MPPTSTKFTNATHDFLNGRSLGEGKGATVYQCTISNKKTKLGDTYAYKSIEYPDDATVEESIILEKLYSTPHRNVVKYIGKHSEGEDIEAFVFECLGGGSVAEQKCPINEANGKLIAKGALKALDHLHNLGIIHRDVTKGNIMYTTQKDTVKLVDVGSGKMVNKGKFAEPSGTTSHQPPEANTDGKVNHKGDVFGLGVTLYSAMTGDETHESYIVNNKLYMVSGYLQGMHKVKSKKFNELSSKAQSFIEALLSPKLKDRPDAATALKHVWLKSDDCGKKTVPPESSSGHSRKHDEHLKHRK